MIAIKKGKILDDMIKVIKDKLIIKDETLYIIQIEEIKGSPMEYLFNKYIKQDDVC